MPQVHGEGEAENANTPAFGLCTLSKIPISQVHISQNIEMFWYWLCVFLFKAALVLIFNLINSTFMSGLMTITCPNRERKAILASSRHAGFIAQHCLYWNSHYWNPHLNSNQHLNTNIHTNSRHIGDQYPSKTSLNTQNTPVVRHTGITRKTIKTKICTIKASAVLHCCKNDQQFTLCPHSNCPTAPRPPNPKKVAIEARKVINAQSLLNCSVESNHEPWW